MSNARMVTSARPVVDNTFLSANGCLHFDARVQLAALHSTEPLIFP